MRKKIKLIALGAGNNLGKLVGMLLRKDIGLKFYNHFFERAPYALIKLMVRFIHLPARNYNWEILLANGKKVCTKIDGSNIKTSQFALSYKWHSPSLNFIEKLLIQHSPPTSPWVDVGANLGLRSLLALSEGRMVYMIEPNQELNAINSERCAMNHFSNYEIISMGASDTNGTAEFYIDESSYNSSLNTAILQNNVLDRKEVISLDSLDSIFSSLTHPPIAIKIDVEGHEMQVLKGAEQLIKRWYPPIIVEVNLVSNNFNAFNGLMKNYGYSLFQIKSYGQNKYLKTVLFEDTNRPETNDFLAVKNIELSKILKSYCV
ncbi:FkbM family methyltransferase [Rhabdobacter roseus]|uniref:FkbM family methyltransferase n=1 Tax=Rhabdobacter roseus TaxID=1655419 RepID=A0A840TJZ4_9BACT|nr:FkbM family methyltransferase [Rhabdobacter roseus]MBB5283255.1 FkbM family methyltransferase [Rhabdobacter roseus]